MFQFPIVALEQFSRASGHFSMKELLRNFMTYRLESTTPGV